MKDECEEVLRLAYLYLDGEGMTEAARFTFKAHLDDCPPCWQRIGLDKEVIELVHKLKYSNPTCPESVKARISALLEEL